MKERREALHCCALSTLVRSVRSTMLVHEVELSCLLCLVNGFTSTVTRLSCVACRPYHRPCKPALTRVCVPPLPPKTAQAVALTGIGLLYQGSAHRLMTEFLLGEIGTKPLFERGLLHHHNVNTDDTDSYSLCAGIALGMVVLGRGGSFVDLGVADVNIEARLMRYIVGGLEQPSHGHVAGGHGGGSSATGGSHGGPAPTRSRHKEPAGVNISVTAPGATIAMGLMYLRTGNRPVANMLGPPGGCGVIWGGGGRAVFFKWFAVGSGCGVDVGVGVSGVFGCGMVWMLWCFEVLWCGWCFQVLRC